MHEPHEVRLPGGHVISDDRTRLDMAFVHAGLATAYWARDRPQAHTERAFAHCLCLGLYAPGGTMAGFGRAMTDYTFRAHLADVFIHPDARGKGLGKALIAAFLAHPALVTVAHWSLTTSDAHGLYTPFGFRLGDTDGKWMALTRVVQPRLTPPAAHPAAR